MQERSYLWDRSGPADPEAAALEALLAPLAHDGRRLAFRPRARPVFHPWFAAAAAVLMGITLSFTLRPAPGALLAARTGPARVGLESIHPRRSLEPGTWFTATAANRELMLGQLGHLALEPGSRLRVQSLETAQARLYLERGTLLASVSGSAQPRFFQVETPSTTCVDLGCKYTLSVDGRGDTVVTVVTGRVAFESAGREVYVPARATCRASRDRGPGTPHFQDAPAPLVAALEAFDAASRGSAALRRERASAVLAQVGAPRDYLPAWHLLQDDDPVIVTAARELLERLAGRPDQVPAAAGPPGPAERQLWKRHLAVQWRKPVAQSR